MIQLLDHIPVIIRSNTLTIITELSARRVRAPLILLTSDAQNARQAAILWGVTPVLLSPHHQQHTQSPIQAQTQATSALTLSTLQPKPVQALSHSSSLLHNPDLDDSELDEAKCLASAREEYELNGSDVWYALKIAGVGTPPTVVVVDDTRLPPVAVQLHHHPAKL